MLGDPKLLRWILGFLVFGAESGQTLLGKATLLKSLPFQAHLMTITTSANPNIELQGQQQTSFLHEGKPGSQQAPAGPACSSFFGISGAYAAVVQSRSHLSQNQAWY